VDGCANTPMHAKDSFFNKRCEGQVLEHLVDSMGDGN
jgi:hypothetical protein